MSSAAFAVETTCTGSGGGNCPAVIPDGLQNGVSSTVIVPANLCGSAQPIGVKVRVDITHSWIGDLTVTVTNPTSSSVVLLDQLGGAPAVSCDGDDIAATFQDGGSAPSCNTATVPSLSGTLAPTTPLAGLAAGALGTWTLTVKDNVNGNNGLINDWGVDVTCGVAGPADVSASLTGFPASPAPNSTANGTLTCSSIGGQAATNVTCSATGGTASNCTLQPANTPVASFPVASLNVGQSIVCDVAAAVSPTGSFGVTGTATAANDSNAANNSANVSVTGTAIADMAVSLSGFPPSAAASAAVSGTLTCANGSIYDATNVDCSVSGGTASACTLQPANTPIGSFPVATVPAGSSIVCTVDATLPAVGPLVLLASTSAANDTNLGNNSAAATVINATNNGAPEVIPTLSFTMQMLLLALLAGVGVRATRRRMRSDA
jgi:subtilisin-like proprotein convertase family protein